MLTPIPDQIKTVEEAKAFIKDLYDNCEDFHPDNRAEDIIVIATGARMFTNEEATRINARFEEIGDLNGFDPCRYLLCLYNYPVMAE